MALDWRYGTKGPDEPVVILGVNLPGDAVVEEDPEAHGEAGAYYLMDKILPRDIRVVRYLNPGELTSRIVQAGGRAEREKRKQVEEFIEDYD